MYKRSAQHLDTILETIITNYSNSIQAHGEVMVDFVEDYRKIRQLEIAAYAKNMARNIPAVKPSLLALVVRKRPVSTSQISQGYQREGEVLEITSIHLARISGKYTEHISQSDRHGEYPSRRIANMRSLRISTPHQKNWIVQVIDQVNQLNAVNHNLKQHYLEVIKMHYNKHRYLTSLTAHQI